MQGYLSVCCDAVRMSKVTEKPWYSRLWTYIVGEKMVDNTVKPATGMAAQVSGSDLFDYSQRVQGHLANRYPELVNVR
jgi:hypothetical protein